MTGFRYVNYAFFLEGTPPPEHSAFHADGETFDRFQVVAGNGVCQMRHTWVAARALWRLTYRLLPSGAWEQGVGPLGWRFACLGPWHTDPRDCVLTSGLEAGEYRTEADARAAWQAWLDQERAEIAERARRLEVLA